MERRFFSNSDFERYVQQNADQYRMFPSEKVWKNVHNTLHKRRRWYGLGLAFLLLLTGTAVTVVMRSYPVTKKQPAIASVNTMLSETTAENTVAIPDIPADIKDLIPFEETGEDIAAVVREQLRPQPFIADENAELLNDLVAEDELVTGKLLAEIKPSRQEMMATVHNKAFVEENEALVVHMRDYPRREAAEAVTTAHAIVKTPADDYTFAGYSPEVAYSVENVLNSFKPGPKRVSWQLFFTPTISYRVLSVNKDFAGSASGPGALPFPFARLEDVNKAVTHKPDIGFQLGITARYPLSKRINLRAGMQVNINKYDIKAFSYPGEVAVINLDDSHSTTVATWTRYRNQNGYKSDWLKNYYLSVSIPVGAEVKLFGNDKTNVGVAGTIQPTYIVRDRAYLISTDYKNYAKVPWLIRRVNMSTGFEAFVNYGTGKTRWQVGPQVRYQLLSSFQNKYPVKENLFDFGLKIGVTVN